MIIHKKGEVDVFGIGDPVRFKKGVEVSVPTPQMIEYETIEKGATGVVKSILPFVVRVADFENGVFKAISWPRSISLSEELELVKARPSLRVVK